MTLKSDVRFLTDNAFASLEEVITFLQANNLVAIVQAPKNIFVLRIKEKVQDPRFLLLKPKKNILVCVHTIMSNNGVNLTRLKFENFWDTGRASRYRGTKAHGN
jgi:hypothetical protein